MISPTIGRVVWYRPSKHDSAELDIHGGQPLAALVTYVWSDTLVNLAVFDTNGSAHSRTSVTLHQDDGPCASSPYCEWMPYQVGQAKKHDAEKSAG